MPNAPKTPAHAVRISDATWAAVRDVADRKGLTASDVVRIALADFLARNG
jgi:antitoxin component of RelBE/YafQ-DinJ toxin-antitoxin module